MHVDNGYSSLCDSGNKKTRRGPSSFWMQDPQLVFRELDIRAGFCFMDLGCGPGDYSLEAARTVGLAGAVYALDKASAQVENLQWTAISLGMDNIRAMVTDITHPLPLSGELADICLVATVLHIPSVSEVIPAVAGEIHRVLKPDGKLAIIECKKEEQPFGPPKHMRLSPSEIDATVSPRGFEMIRYADLGYNYMIQFVKK